MNERKNHFVTEDSEIEPSINADASMAGATKPNTDAINHNTIVKAPDEAESELVQTKAKIQRKRKPKYEQKEHKIKAAPIRLQSQPTWEYVPVNLRKPEDDTERNVRRDTLAGDLAPSQIL